MSPYTIVLRKIDSCSCKRQLESRQRPLEKTAVVKARAYIVSIDKKNTVYKLEACENAVFTNAYFGCCETLGNCMSVAHHKSTRRRRLGAFSIVLNMRIEYIARSCHFYIETFWQTHYANCVRMVHNWACEDKISPPGGVFKGRWSEAHYVCACVQD